MGLSIAEYGQAKFGNEIANFGGGKRPAAAGKPQEATGSAPVGYRLDRKPVKLQTDGEEGISVRPPQEKLKVGSKSTTSASELQFQVKTAEGDTVTLSVSALRESSVDKLSYKSADGSLKVAQKRESSSVQASIAVEGNLSQAELADISKALESLSQGKAIEDLGTLESASFQFRNRTVTRQSQLSVVG
jgi:hypothetical protein